MELSRSLSRSWSESVTRNEFFRVLILGAELPNFCECVPQDKLLCYFTFFHYCLFVCLKFVIGLSPESVRGERMAWIHKAAVIEVARVLNDSNSKGLSLAVSIPGAPLCPRPRVTSFPHAGIRSWNLRGVLCIWTSEGTLPPFLGIRRVKIII